MKKNNYKQPLSGSWKGCVKRRDGDAPLISHHVQHCIHFYFSKYTAFGKMKSFSTSIHIDDYQTVVSNERKDLSLNKE